MVISMTILGFSETEIVKKAVENQSASFDGVVQYNYETGELFGCSMSTGETENPSNPFIEVFRLKQGELGEYHFGINKDMCFGCDFYDAHCKVYSEDDFRETVRCKECCIDSYVDDDFEDDFENHFKDGLELQIMDILGGHLRQTIIKMNEIRVELSDILHPYSYFDVRQDNWCFNVLDSYIDLAMADGFTLVDPISYLDAEMQYITDCATYGESNNSEEEKILGDVAGALRQKDLDKALEILGVDLSE